MGFSRETLEDIANGINPFVGRAYILNKPILSEFEEKTKHFHNMQKPAHEREILVTMSDKEIAEVFSARLMTFLKEKYFTKTAI